jgi:uncharacterized protein
LCSATCAYNVTEDLTRRPCLKGRTQEASGELKLHADSPTALNTVTAYGPGFIEINRVRHTSALLLTPERVEPWNVESFDALNEGDFELLRALKPEVALLGTGSKQRFPHPRITRPLTDAGIGLEAMSTAAACRTYNILMAEGRKVAAVVILEADE